MLDVHTIAPEVAMADSLRYFMGDELPAKVFIDKYALRDGQDELVESNPEQMHRRLAREFARIEAGKFKNPYSEDYLYSLFSDFGEIIPQGSPMYGIGNRYKITSLSNCYVVPSPLDSYGSIHEADEHLTQISKRRGGVGMDLSNLRPDGAATNNSARTSSGVVSFMERYSNSIREVGQRGRRGALMLTLDVHHPDVVAFCRVKLDPAKVTGANVSVRLTDEFLKAVECDGYYEQRWPIKGKPVVSRTVKAREVWREIIKCAHARAEPGILFWDSVIRESPADCYADEGFETISTNPCGELPLCFFDSCRLLLLNLFMFVRSPFKNGKFDFAEFRKKAGVAQRLMDDLIDLEVESLDRIIGKVKGDPEPPESRARELRMWEAIRAKCLAGRRTGTGITALGDAMAAVGIRYGSQESVEFTEAVYKMLKLGAYEASVEMARELGPFPVWNPEKEKECPFLLRIRDEEPSLYADMQKYGRRNIALLTTAPAGTTSIEAGPRPYFGTTSGIEPLFMTHYMRRKKIVPGVDVKVDFVDQNGDRWQEFPVYHSKVKMWMDVTGETDPSKSPYAGCCAEELDWRMRVRIQAVATRHIDHSISSTANLPEDVTEEEVATIYEEAWRSGCKGFTVYRKNCRSGVLVEIKKPEKLKVGTSDAPKRPRDLPCDIHRVKVKGVEYCVVVGTFLDSPYEVFAGLVSDLSFPKRHAVGRVVKKGRGHYRLVSESGELLCESLTAAISDEEDALTRMVSTSLRHGVPLNFIVHQLEKTRGVMVGFTKGLARVLKQYVPDGTEVTGETCPQCSSTKLIRQEGCATCTCGWSKCL